MFSGAHKVIRLQAISLGYAVPRGDFNTAVHSVFPEVINLQSGNERRLLTLVTADCADLPQGIRLDTPPGFSFEKELHAGDRMACRNSFLGDGHGHLSIDMHNAKRWKCELPDLDGDEIAPPVAAAWNSVWQALDEHKRRINYKIPRTESSITDFPGEATFSRIMDAHVRALVEAVRNLDTSVGTSLAGLIGLGPGLTPSGDDFLVGFLTGLHCTAGKKRERLAFLSELEKMIVRLSRQTNDISRTYLFHAAHGQVSSRLVALLEEITRGEDSDRLLQAADDALQVGHSSGLDTVTGLLFGLSTWGKGLLPIYTL